METSAHHSASENHSHLPAIVGFGILLLLILWLGFYLGKCLTGPAPMGGVLGVSTFSTGASQNPVINGQSFTFSSTAVADSNGLLNATVKFDLSGQGVIDNNIHGPGTCLKVTDATAVCNNVNAQPNETLTWNVPVTPNSNCSTSNPASISFQAQLIAIVGTFSSTTGVNCVAAQPTTTTAATPTPTSGGNATPTPTTTTTGGTNGSTGSTGTTGQNGSGGTSGTNGANGTQSSGQSGTQGGAGGTNPTPANSNASLDLAAMPAATGGKAVNLADLVCSRVSGFPTIYLLLLLWLIAVISYVLMHKREHTAAH